MNNWQCTLLSSFFVLFYCCYCSPMTWIPRRTISPQFLSNYNRVLFFFFRSDEWWSSLVLFFFLSFLHCFFCLITIPGIVFKILRKVQDFYSFFLSFRRKKLHWIFLLFIYYSKWENGESQGVFLQKEKGRLGKLGNYTKFLFKCHFLLFF